jgi:hypothetical protein
LALVAGCSSNKSAAGAHSDNAKSSTAVAEPPGTQTTLPFTLGPTSIYIPDGNRVVKIVK